MGGDNNLKAKLLIKKLLMLLLFYVHLYWNYLVSEFCVCVCVCVCCRLKVIMKSIAIAMAHIVIDCNYF